MKSHKWLLDKLYEAGDVVPSTRKLKYVSPILNSLSRFSENLRKLPNKIQNSENL